MLSVNTNPGALVALQNLLGHGRQPFQTQNESLHLALRCLRRRTTARVLGHRPERAGTSGSLTTPSCQSLQARSVDDPQVATSAGTSVSNLLNQLKTLALSGLKDTSLDATSLAATNAQFGSVLGPRSP